MISLKATIVAFALSANPQAVLLDFYADWCGPCRQMHSVVAELAQRGYPVRQVNIDQDRNLAAQYQVQSVPTFVLVVDGQEVDRVVGATSRKRLEKMFRRAGVGNDRRQQGSSEVAAVAHTPPRIDDVRAQSPDDSLVPVNVPGAPTSAPLSSGPPGPNDFPPQPGMPRAQATTPAMSAPRWEPPAAQHAQPTSAPAEIPSDVPAASSGAVEERLLAASVRIRVNDPNGHSVGSGTIVDARGGKALIVTCGHIFRDSDGKGCIEVDLFSSGLAETVEGVLIGYDLERDVALVGIVATEELAVAPLAARGTTVNVGDPVFNVGCNNGAEPTLRASRVSAIDKYLGPPNIEVAGQPVEGRSGGGLFTADGRMIGVCNAADPADDEGLYAALASIHQEMDRAGLGAIADEAHPPADVPPTDFAQAPQRRMPPNLARDEMPLAAASQEAWPSSPDAAMPTNAPGGPYAAPVARHVDEEVPAELSREESAALAEIGARSPGAEVICVIRPLDNPRAKTQIIVLDRASPAFLESLAGECQAQDARHLTSLTIPDRVGNAQPTTAPRRAHVDESMSPTNWQPKWGKPSVR